MSPIMDDATCSSWTHGPSHGRSTVKRSENVEQPQTNFKTQLIQILLCKVSFIAPSAELLRYGHSRLMKSSTSALRSFASLLPPRRPQRVSRLAHTPIVCARCLKAQIRGVHTPAEEPGFTSVVDHPPNLVRTGRKHGPGLILLGMFSSGLH